MDDVIYLIVEEDVVEILEVGMQGLPGVGFSPEILATIAASNNPSPENPFATMTDLPNTPAAVGAAPAVHPHADKADLVNGKVPAEQLPGYMDDVLEYASLAAMPAEGEAGKIYVALDTNLVYRWSGSAYVAINPGLALGETAATAYRGDRGAAAYAHATETPHAPPDAEKNYPVAGLEQDADLDGETPFSWPPVRLAAKIAAKVAAIFTNKTTLDKITESAGNKPLFNGQAWPLCLLYVDITEILTNSAAEVVLKTITIPGGLPGPTGALRITMLSKGTGTSATSRACRVRLGGTGIDGVIYLNATLPTTFISNHGMSIIRNKNSEAVQEANVSSSSPFGSTPSPPVTSAVNTAQDYNLYVTGFSNNAADYAGVTAIMIEVLK